MGEGNKLQDKEERAGELILMRWWQRLEGFEEVERITNRPTTPGGAYGFGNLVVPSEPDRVRNSVYPVDEVVRLIDPAGCAAGCRHPLERAGGEQRHGVRRRAGRCRRDGAVPLTRAVTVYADLPAPPAKVSRLRGIRIDDRLES
jgi:hypothetical protein